MATPAGLAEPNSINGLKCQTAPLAHTERKGLSRTLSTARVKYERASSRTGTPDFLEAISWLVRRLQPERAAMSAPLPNHCGRGNRAKIPPFPLAHQRPPEVKLAVRRAGERAARAKKYLKPTSSRSGARQAPMRPRCQPSAAARSIVYPAIVSILLKAL